MHAGHVVEMAHDEGTLHRATASVHRQADRCHPARYACTWRISPPFRGICPTCGSPCRPAATAPGASTTGRLRYGASAPHRSRSRTPGGMLEAAVTPLLEVAGLQKHFPIGAARRAGALPAQRALPRAVHRAVPAAGARCRWRLVDHLAWRMCRPGRRIRQWQVDARPHADALARPDGWHDPLCRTATSARSRPGALPARRSVPACSWCFRIRPTA